MARDARRFVPKKTGELHFSIEVKKDIKKDDGSVHLAYVTAGTRERGGAFYAGFVELGTKKMRAKPYLRPAIQKNKRTGMNDLSTAFKKVIR